MSSTEFVPTRFLYASTTSSSFALAMPQFEPSTWAEVSEAHANNNKIAQQPPYVLRVRDFTHAPHCYLTHTSLFKRRKPYDDFSPQKSSHRLNSALLNRPPHSDGLFDDLLGLGRVDLARGILTRRHASAKPKLSLIRTPSVFNPCSNLFDPVQYLARIHVRTSAQQLRQGKHVLIDIETLLDTLKQQYTQEKYIVSTYVQAQFQTVIRSMRPLAPFPDRTTPLLTQQRFRRAEKLLRTRYERLIQRASKLQKLQNALLVYKRISWVFNLPNLLHSAIDADRNTVENAFREYLRAKDWLSAQRLEEFQTLRDQLQIAFNQLINSVVVRLSNVQTLSADISRLVTALFSVNKGGELSVIMTNRMETAEKALHSAIVAAELPSFAAEDAHSDIGDLISRASEGFYLAVGHVWRLARLLVDDDRWLQIANSNVVRLCEMYVKVIRDDVMQDISLITQPVVKEIATTHLRVLDELRVPEIFLTALQSASAEATDVFLKSLAQAVRRGAHQIAATETKQNKIGVLSASFLRAVLVEALTQIDTSWVRGKEAHEDEFEMSDSDENDDSVADSSVDLLSSTCARAPMIFAQTVEKLMNDFKQNKNSALQLAVCCAEVIDRVLKAVEEKTGQESPFNSRATKRRLSQASSGIEVIRDKALDSYVELVFEPLQMLAGKLVKFPNDKLGDSVRRNLPIKIVGVSSCAKELVLQLVLVIITTRTRTRHPMLIRQVLLELILGIGRTLIRTLSTDKLPYEKAAQLWVDVMYVHATVTKGANEDTQGLQAALDGLSKVKERAVQAVLADGYSFSLVDMKTLREEVVEIEMQGSSMICECFMETWSLLKGTSDE